MVISCLIGHGTAHASSLHLEVRGSLIDLQAERVPLIRILNALADRTGFSLTLQASVTEAVSCQLKDVSLEECISRLLANRSHVMVYKKVGEDRFEPIKLLVFDDGSMGVLNGQAFRASGQILGPGSDAPPPEDPIKRCKREWFERKFKDEKKLSSQISAKPVSVPMNNMPDATGFRITRLSENSVLREIGLKKGDIIADVNGQPVGTAKEFIQALRSAPESNHPIRIERLKNDLSMDPIYIEFTEPLEGPMQ